VANATPFFSLKFITGKLPATESRVKMQRIPVIAIDEI